MNNIEIHQNISILFKATRKFHGLLQAEFAKILGVTQGSISKIEAGTMNPDLGVWFRLLRSFEILDPYCFTYSGLEYNEEVFDLLKVNGSTLAPKFDFKTNAYLSSVRKIRPLFDYLESNNSKVLARFLEEQSVSVELFYIYNHPLTTDFVESFFSYLDESKMNAKSFALMDLGFQNSLGRQFEELTSSQNEKNFYELLNSNSQDFVEYEYSDEKNEYFVNISAKNISRIKNLNNSEFILNYNLLYPFHVLKSLKVANTSLPKIHEIKENHRWRISHVS
jgi:DNA-binding XRE family transcriptional regulator